MFLVPRRQIWTSQPSIPSGIDRAAPMGNQEWACVYVPGVQLTGTANPVGTLKGNTRLSVGKAGRSLYQPDTLTPNVGLSFGANPKMQLGISSGIAVVRNLSTSSTTMPIYLTNSTTTSDGGFYLDINNHKARLIKANVALLLESSNSAAPGEVCTIAWSYNNVTGRARIAFNGVLTSGSATAEFSHNACVLAGYDPTTWTGTYPTEVFLFGLSPTECFSDVALVETSNAPWQIFKRPDSRIFVPVLAGGSGTTTVTSDSSASYKIQGSVQASASATYSIHTSVQSSTSATYGIRGSIQQSATPSYAIRAAIQQDTAANYLIQGAVDQAITASYAIRSAISSDAAAAYSILSATAVSSSTSAGYNIRGGINQDNVANYLIRGSINQDSAASYALRGSIIRDTSATYSILSASSVSASVTAGYVVKGSIQSSIVAGYSIAQAVQAEIAASYIIRSGVVSEAQAAYIVRGLVQQSVAASYSVFSEYAAPSTFADRTDLKSMMTQHAELKSMMTQHLLLQASIG